MKYLILYVLSFLLFGLGLITVVYELNPLITWSILLFSFFIMSIAIDKVLTKKFNDNEEYQEEKREL